MLAQSRRRWTNSKPTLDQHLVLVAYDHILINQTPYIIVSSEIPINMVNMVNVVYIIIERK